MSRDQLLGLVLLAGSIVAVLVYGYLLMSPFSDLVIKITLFIGVLVVFGVLAWIGYTLATTPPPKPIEEIEKEIEEELKKLEKESGEAPKTSS
ncbi:MAG: transcriptional regulator [Sulfolobales archaeon]